MAARVNPGDGEMSAEELAAAAGMTLTAATELPEDEPLEEPGTEAEAEAESEESEPIAEDDEEPRQPAKEPKQSRREGKKQPGSSVDLSKSPEFRKWQSEQDKKTAEHQRRAEEAERRAAQLEAQMQQQQAAQAEAQAQALERQLDDVVDPAQRQMMINQIAYSRFQALQNYDAEVRRTVASEGLDPADYPSQKYLGPDGRTRLMSEIQAAKNKRLARENEELKKQAAPETIDALVKAALAKALQGAGLNHVDAGETQAPSRGGTDDEEKALWKRVQRGDRKAEAEYKRRFGV